MPWSASVRQACPSEAAKIEAERRRSDHPRDRLPLSISAMLTVNSPLRLMNSRVPSSGSTRKIFSDPGGTRPAETSSSATTGMSGIFGGKRSQDMRLGPIVRFGHGRAIALMPVTERAVRIYRHDFAAGAKPDIDQGLESHGRKSDRCPARLPCPL